MALTDPHLIELASLYGIATEFWDWKGRHTEVSAATVVAVLSSMEVDASTSEKAGDAVQAFRRRSWQRALPPCVVTEQGTSVVVNVHVQAGAGALVYVRLEDGGFRDAAQVANHAPDREIDGSLVGEASFEIPSDTPLGYHRLVLRSDDREFEATLIVSPPWLGFPRQMGDRRIWGYAAQLYSVRSADSWGIGDLTDLEDLTIWSATQQFTNYVLINPLHAAQPMAPMDPSPYLPSSRRYVNPLYIRPEAIPEFAALTGRQRKAVRRLRQELQDQLEGEAQLHRNPSWSAKREALWQIYQQGRRASRAMAFEDFARREGRPLRDFAVWCALMEEQGGTWKQWPEELQRPSSPEVAAFAAERAEVVNFHAWMQWVADQQLSNAQQAAKDVGMLIGIVNDLAVGVNSAGADTWAMRDVFAQGATVGAPPDPYNQSGQDWGQPPWRPDRLADFAYAPFRNMVNGILRHSGGIRVDHIIGLFRLWWIPSGHGPQEGTYVRYDHDALVGILALEAHRAGALVIGEDLGTVEPWVRDYLRRRGILGTSILWFENDSEGKPLAPEQWREYCMASVTTHDLPPSAGYLAHDHVRLRSELGLLTETLEDEMNADAREQAAVLGMLEDLGALEEGDRDTEDVVLAMHRFLTWTPSRVMSASLTDAVGDRLTQNQPGTVDEYPNWRVPLSGPDGKPMLLEDVYTSDRALRLSAVMNGFTHVPERRGWAAEQRPESTAEAPGVSVS